jgi:hypothetical protein
MSDSTPSGVVPGNGARRARFHFYSIDDLLSLRPPGWLVEGMIPVGAFVVMYGPSGEGKTFTALDMALCIATGRPWHGRPTKFAPVLYVAGEGITGIRPRVEAWMRVNGCSRDEMLGVFFCADAVQLANDKDVADFIVAAKDAGAGFVVLDTFARSFVGGDENAAKDVGEAVDGVRKILSELTSDWPPIGIMALHHTGKSTTSAGQLERGSSAIRAAVDTSVFVSQNSDDIVMIRCEKQRDGEPFELIALRLEQIPLTIDGLSTTSCVLRPVEEKDEKTSARGRLTSGERATLQALFEMPDATGKTAEWIVRSQQPSRTLHHNRTKLQHRGYVEQAGHAIYRLTAEGRSALGIESASAKNVQ